MAKVGQAKRGLKGWGCIIVASIAVFVLPCSSVANAAEWIKTYGGADFDQLSSIQQTSDGGYVVAGGTASFGSGRGDAWVLKLDAGGNIQWQKTYGSIAVEEAFSIQQTSDGGYVVAGEMQSWTADLSDAWVLKLDGSGNIQWQKTFGVPDYGRAESIR
ncbi:MAG: hypothetical protein ACE5I9_05040 [Candidatus Methylomirabilales bacterium]